jgi:hypothetical protein
MTVSLSAGKQTAATFDKDRQNIDAGRFQEEQWKAKGVVVLWDVTPSLHGITTHKTMSWNHLCENLKSHI